MKTKMHSLIALFLGCIMLMGMVQTGAFADTAVDVNSWEDLRNSLIGDENKIVKLTDDISLELPKETDEGVVPDYYTIKITGGTKTLDLNGKKLYVSGGADTTEYLTETSLIQLSGNASLTITSTADEKGTLTYQNAKGNSGFDGRTSAVTMKDKASLNVNNANIITWKGNTLALAEGSPDLTVGKYASITSMNSMAIAAYNACTGGSIKIKDAAEIGRSGEIGNFHQTSIMLSGYGALKIYSSDVSLDITDGVLYGSVDVYSETQKNAFSATQDKAIIINGAKRTDNNFWTENATYSEKGILVTGQYLLTPDISKIMYPSESVLVTPNTISKASVTVNTPVGGKKQDKTTVVIPIADVGKYTASVKGWYNSDGTAVADDETFTAGRQYTVHVDVEANQGFSWADNFAANINGKNAVVESTDETNKKLIKYTFTATAVILEDIYAASVTVREPAAYEVLVPDKHDAVSADSGKYIVDSTSWYEGESTAGTSIPVNGTKAFEIGKSYTVSVKLLPADGKKFVSGTIIKINDKDAVVTTIPPDGSAIYAKYTYTVVPPITSPEIMLAKVTVREPAAGEKLLSETHNAESDEPYWYIADQTNWYEGTSNSGKQIPMNGTVTFELGKKYTVYVKLLPVNDMKFVYEKTTARINDKNADIQTQIPDGSVIYIKYTFDAAPGGTKITFDRNGGTGTQDPLYADEYDDVTMPECTFTKEGDEFFAWNVGGSLYFPGDSCNITQNTTAAAVWKSELTKDIALTMSTISEGKTPAEIDFGYDTAKFSSVSAVWYEGDSVDKFKIVNSSAPLSVSKNYTVQLTIDSTEFLAPIDELNITLNDKKMENILQRESKKIIVDVQILNDIGVEFFEPMGGVPLATSYEMKPNSYRFFVSTVVWFDKPNAALKDKLDSGVVAELGKTYYLTLNLRSTAENQIFGGDTVKVNGKAYPITSRGGVSGADFVAAKPQFTATYPQVKISEDSKGYIIVNSPIAMNVTLAAALYDAKGKLIDVGTAPNYALASGNNKISPADIVGTEKLGSYLLRVNDEKVKILVLRSMSSLSPLCPALNYKKNLR